MDKHSKQVKRSNSDHAALVSRGSSSKRSAPDKPNLPAPKATKSATNLSQPVTTTTKARSKLTVKKKLYPEEPKPEVTSKQLAVVTTAGRKFPMEKSLTMSEMESPSKKKKQQQNQELEEQVADGQSCSMTVLPSVGHPDHRQGITGNSTAKLVYETGFKMLLKCWRDKKTQINRLNTLLSHKDSNSIKYRNQLQTIDSLFKNECKNHEQARFDLRTAKQKLESTKAALLEEKTAHLAKVSDLEASVLQREKLQGQLTHTEEELAKAIINWHSFEYKWHEREDRCVRLEADKKELLKQIDDLEENFKKFERDFEKTQMNQSDSNKLYEVRIEHFQKKIDGMKGQIEVYETDCELLKEWNVRLAEELSQVKGTYHASYGYRLRRFLANLPRKPGFYAHYLLYLFTHGVPVPKKRRGAQLDQYARYGQVRYT